MNEEDKSVDDDGADADGEEDVPFAADSCDADDGDVDVACADDDGDDVDVDDGDDEGESKGGRFMFVGGGREDEGTVEDVAGGEGSVPVAV